MGVGQLHRRGSQGEQCGAEGGGTPGTRRLARSLPFVRTALLIVVLVAFGVRLYQLGVKSFWFDEGLSVFEARAPLRELLPILIRDEIHPPLYYAMLAVWLRFVGQTEFAVRYLSLLFGVLLVPATYRLGRELFAATTSSPEYSRATPRSRQPVIPSDETVIPSGARNLDPASPLAAPQDRPDETNEPTSERLGGHLVGLGGAALVAVSPFLVDYSQEARMYALLALLAVLSSIAFWWLLHRPGRIAWISYPVLVAALGYTHYFAVFVVAAHFAYVALTLRQSVRRAKSLALALAVAVMLYLPWAPGAAAQLLRLQTTPDFWAGELSFAYFLDRLFASFAIGKSGLATTNVALAAGLAFLVVAGIGIGLWRGIAGHRRNDLFLALTVLVPLGCLYAITVRQPKFTERYVIMVVPSFYLMLARLMVVLGQVGQRIAPPTLGRLVFSSLPLSLGAVTFLVVLVVSLAELPQVYHGEPYANEDFRAVADYIADHEEPGDAVGLLMDSHQAFEVYYQGGLPVYSLHANADPNAAAQLINTATEGKQRLWLVLWQPDWGDPAWYVRESLFSAFSQYPVPERFTGLELIVLDLSPQIRFDGRLTPHVSAPVNFENQIRLLGYDLPQESVAAGTKPSIVLYWQAGTSLTQDISVSLRLRDDRHVWWRYDGRPAAFTYPTYRWRPEQTTRGRLPIEVPPGTPPGEYDLEVGMYPQETRRDLNILDANGNAIGTSAVIGRIRVTQPAVPPPDPAKGAPPVATFGDVQLLRVDVETPQVTRGDAVQLELLWHALREIDRDLRVRVTVHDSAGRETVLAEGPPADGRLPTSEWRANELLRDRYHAAIPLSVAAGPARLQIALLDGDAQVGAIDVGAVEIGGRPVTMERPADVGTPTDFRVENLGRLIGYRLSPDGVPPGGEVQLTLYWEALGASPITYTVFTHLLDGQEKVWAQQDNPPLQGAAPTTSWQPGEYLRDEYTLRLKDDAPPGEYVVEVGMYDAATGQRLPIFDGSGAPIGDRVLLGQVLVER